MFDWNKKRLELMGMGRLIDGPTSVDELRDLVIDRWRIPNKPLDEVYPKVFIGGERAAKDPALLKSLGITHIVNAAIEEVKTGEVTYIQQGYRFSMMKIDAKDSPTFNMSPYFEEVNRFIEVAMHTGGKVLIHCNEGVSRAAILVIAYLMIRRELCALEAVRVVRAKRHIRPNDGFLQQIVNLDNKMRREQRF